MGHKTLNKRLSKGKNRAQKVIKKKTTTKTRGLVRISKGHKKINQQAS